MGVALLIAFGAMFLGRHSPGFVWLLIPALVLLGRGIGELVSVMTAHSRAKQIATPPVERTGELPADSFYDPLAPPSVTERTTRQLEAVEQERQRAR